MIETALQCIRVSGFAGAMIVLCSALLLLAAIVAGILAAVLRNRKPMGVFVGLALLPLFLGAAGTIAGYSRVNSIRKAAPDTDDAVLAAGELQARCPLYIGSASSMLFVTIGLIGFGVAAKGQETRRGFYRVACRCSDGDNIAENRKIEEQEPRA